MTKTVLITGCSSGFGQDMARVFLARGWNVTATMRSPERSALSASERLLVTRLDVQDRTSIEAAVARTLARFGTLDVLINNAGFSMMGVFEEIPRDCIQEQFDVNLFGLMDVTRAVLPTMRQQRSGVIVNVSSSEGLYAVPMLSAYHASKFAVEGFSESLAYELASVGIAVKLIEPGAVVTTGFARRAMAERGNTADIEDYAPFHAAMEKVFAGRMAARFATPEDVARTAFEAATDGSSRLRYVVGPDSLPFIEARQRTSEEDYMTLMRRTYPLLSPDTSSPPPPRGSSADPSRRESFGKGS
jgi:NAD(P)-dependent dehydrogenase (short-subunit alcohol dehydrogenase family)